MKSIYSIYIIIILLFNNFLILAQQGIVEGKIKNALTNEPIPFSVVIVWNTQIAAVADADGNFKLDKLKPGYIKLQVSSLGYESKITEDIYVTNSKTTHIEVLLQENITLLNEVTIKSSPFEKKELSPISLRTVTISEIEKNPGGNRDISRVIQSFPGVGFTPSYRNDVVVRGGGASENRYYLDGIELPNINHFATQGASGGSVGIINVDFIRQVNFYSGAFPASRGNALSSVIEFVQLDADKDKYNYKLSIGASDIAFTSNGPTGKNSGYIFSARRSYLQFLFSALGLPFLPTYNDFQFKERIKFDDKNEITFIGIGAIDKSKLNLDANKTEEQRFILGYLPVYEQWNYAVGVVYKHFKSNGFETFVLSRNMLNNKSYKYFNNDNTSEANKIFDYDSFESENKFRYEHNTKVKNYNVVYGGNLELARYSNSTSRIEFTNKGIVPFNYQSTISFIKWGGFVQTSRKFLKNRLIASLGLRTDANSYSSLMSNAFNQISPRFSISYSLTEKVSLIFNTGRYYQLPAYTVLGYRDSLNILINKQNKVRYISSDHLVGGVEWLPSDKSKLSLESFYKYYNHYPFSLTDSVSLASKGGDFGSVGDEAVAPVSKGESYGFEILAQHRVQNKVNIIFSYTYVRSFFKGPDNKKISSSWDTRHLLNATTTYILKNNWEVGLKWRFVGGRPYTPYDITRSEIQSVWDVNRRGLYDYSQFNAFRLKPFHQLDIRIDKEYFLKKATLNFYVDVQNVYNFKSIEQDYLTPQTDINGVPIIINDLQYGNKYKLRAIKVKSGTVLPTVGIIIEF